MEVEQSLILGFSKKEASMPVRKKEHIVVCHNLRQLRQRASLSIAQASKLLCQRGIAVGERYLRQWEDESDLAEPIFSDLADICDVYGCELEAVFAPLEPTSDLETRDLQGENTSVNKAL